MPDPMQSSDVEDFLSSIRRLVSNDHARTGRRSQNGGAEGALVLTPADRVPEAGDGETDASAPGKMDPEVAEAFHGPARITIPKDARRDVKMSLEERIAELEAAVSASQIEWEPDGSEAVEDEMPDAMVLEPSTQVTADTPRAAWNDPDAADTAATEDDEAVAMAASDEEASAQDGAPDEDIPDDFGSDAAMNGDAREPSEKFGDVMMLYPSEAVGETPADDERDDERDEDLAATLGRAGADDEAGVIDEQALREMVAEIVREELQGALGEKITRNVRRLVRREIQRALTMRDFE